MEKSRTVPAAKLDAYDETILELLGGPANRIDLRRPIGDAERAALGDVGLDRPFGVLTAENPCGENEEDAPTDAETEARSERNDRRLATLVATLGQESIPFVRVDGVAPDGSYRERCVAIPVDRDEALRLALRFDQLALFWFDGDAFWLLPAEAGGSPKRLPLAEGEGTDGE
jgi:hypothetical protein